MASVALTRRSCTAALLGPLAPGPVLAQSVGFPDRTLHLIVPASPGGVQDVQSRRLAARLGVALHQQLLVESKPGGGMSVAMQALKQSVLDGQTMLMASVQMTIQAHLLKLAYDPLRDINTVTLFTYGPLVLVAPAAAAFATLGEMLDQARALLRTSLAWRSKRH